MTVYDELVARGLIAQVTDEEEIKELVNNGKAVFYIGFDPTADSLHVGHFMALCLMKRLQEAGNKPIALIVPSSVDTTVAISAMDIVVYKDSIISLLWNIRSYHISENPSKFVSERPELKEKMIIKTIGR